MSTACRTYAADLSAYFDQELEQDERELVESHLAGCAACRATLERFGALRMALRSLATKPGRRGSVLQDLKNRVAEEEEDADERPPHVS